MAQIFGDYQKYLSFIDDYACFSNELFLSSKNQKYSSFFTDIIQTQNFSHFIHNEPQKHELFNKIALRNSGHRTTNVSRPSGILSMFTKTKLLDLNLKDITISSQSEIKTSHNSSVLSGENQINNSKAATPDNSIVELYVPPFFLKTSLLDIEKIEESISESKLIY